VDLTALRRPSRLAAVLLAALGVVTAPAAAPALAAGSATGAG
jgi:hypothetical protein